VRSLHSLLAFAVVLTPSPLLAEDAAPAATSARTDIGRFLPGSLHGGFLANLPLLLHDFPGIAHEGWLGSRIDRWVEKGYPDPRAMVGQVGIGLNIQGRSLKDLVLLGHGPLRLAHRVRQLAERANLPLHEIPYRGVVFLRPGFESAPLWFTEPRVGTSYVHFNPRGRFPVSKEMVDVLSGRRPSYGDKHGMSLTPETYVTAGVQVPVATREALAQDVHTAGLHLVIQAAVDWRRSGTKVQLGIELETFTPVEARLLASWMRGRVEWLRTQFDDETVQRLLAAIEIAQSGKHVILRLKHEFDLMREGFLALNRRLERQPLL